MAIASPRALSKQALAFSVERPSMVVGNPSAINPAAMPAAIVPVPITTIRSIGFPFM
jgi:hypothetical protein